MYHEKSDQILDQKEVIRSGLYGDLSIAVSDSFITGVYEFYDGWDSGINEFSRVNVFYFCGLDWRGNEINIKAGWPGNKLIEGKLIIDSDTSIRLLLEDQPNGYAAIDFSSDTGYGAKLETIRDWKEIRIVKDLKAYFYENVSMNKSKAYLVNGDIVKIMGRNNGWVNVVYLSPYTNKTTAGWMPEKSLYAKEFW